MEEINLGGNQIYELPDWLFELRNLKKLKISLNDLEDVPAAIAKATQLEELAFDSPVKKPLPKELGSLTKLKKLVVHEKIYGFPKELFELKNLEEIELNAPLIKTIPEDFKSLPKLKSFTLMQLWFSEKQVVLDVENILEILSKSSCLERLNLSDSMIKAIPKTITSLTGLKELILSTNQISTLPEQLFELKDLRVLDLSMNKIKEVPKGFEKLEKLQTLLLNANYSPKIQLQNLFKHSLKNLQKLDISSCETKIDIPETIIEFSSLKELDFDNNQIKHLPDAILNIALFNGYEI